jgi:hypothetical protein
LFILLSLFSLASNDPNSDPDSGVSGAMRNFVGEPHLLSRDLLERTSFGSLLEPSAGVELSFLSLCRGTDVESDILVLRVVPRLSWEEELLRRLMRVKVLLNSRR